MWKSKKGIYLYLFFSNSVKKCIKSWKVKYVLGYHFSENSDSVLNLIVEILYLPRPGRSEAGKAHNQPVFEL